MINSASCKRKHTILEEFISTKEISRTHNSKSIYSHLDLYAIIICTKSTNILIKRDDLGENTKN